MSITIKGFSPDGKIQNGKIVFVSKGDRITMYNPPDERLYPGEETYPGEDVFPGGNE